jgi:hypothetical protein
MPTKHHNTTQLQFNLLGENHHLHLQANALLHALRLAHR